jgi:hypothetical protein
MFVDKYLTTNQIMLIIEIRNMQIYQHKITCKNKCQPICQFQYPKPPIKHTKILLPLDEQDHMSNHGEISIQIYEKLIDMGLGEDFFFEQFL